MRSSHFEWRHLYRKQSLTHRQTRLQKMLKHAAIELRSIEAELVCRGESIGSPCTRQDGQQSTGNTPIGNLSVDGSVDKNPANRATGRARPIRLCDLIAVPPWIATPDIKDGSA